MERNVHMTPVESQWLMQTSHLIWIRRQSFLLLFRTQHRNHFKPLDFECKTTNGAHQVLWLEEASDINSLCHGRRNQYLVSYCMRLCSSHKSFPRLSPFTAHDIMWSAGNHIQVCRNFCCKKKKFLPCVLGLHQPPPSSGVWQGVQLLLFNKCAIGGI